MMIRSPIALVALLTLAACNKPADTTVTTVATTEYSSSGAPGTAGTAVSTNSALPDDIQTAVAISQAMKRYPAKGDSVLTAFHLTANDFAALMKRIAADSAMSAQFRQLTE